MFQCNAKSADPLHDPWWVAYCDTIVIKALSQLFFAMQLTCLGEITVRAARLQWPCTACCRLKPMCSWLLAPDSGANHIKSSCVCVCVYNTFAAINVSCRVVIDGCFWMSGQNKCVAAAECLLPNSMSLGRNGSDFFLALTHDLPRHLMTQSINPESLTSFTFGYCCILFSGSRTRRGVGIFIFAKRILISMLT